MNNRAVELNNAARDIAAYLETMFVDWRHQTKRDCCKLSDPDRRNRLIDDMQRAILQGLEKWKVI